MFIVGLLSWWYTAGWQQCLLRTKARVDGMLDYFSIGLLVKTLFAPFRQISAGQVRGPLDVQMRAFLDRLISRFIGMMVRLVMIVVGGVMILLSLLMGGVLLLFWALVPLLPLLGLGLFILGWVPWNN